ncbi:CoA pyrophosphatase [Corynebacterium sp. ES2794-CONJ1]|uniref:NUDIX hydrolase n=1 Tax=unclassified Corynebacterium TaxID=2624378 RepID=UPI0021671DFF|nr:MULTISPECIES: CoA pyrophosphatase [unclassified Corynebacterium]MCS4492095.1 CoA pyrophosphatase [Corynebacterium sp. ES2715-CONJ3]MCU9519599.1 CoA pyrophosphatase [Corynebacterium sp. ES2794-CONJ1]
MNNRMNRGMVDEYQAPKFESWPGPRWLAPVTTAARSGQLRQQFHEDVAQRAPIDDSKAASVLMLVTGAETGSRLPDDAAVLLTHRSPTMRQHSGQIAFPGGRIDPEDSHALAAALREAREEVGLDAAAVTPLADIGRTFIGATGAPVHTILAYAPTPPDVTVASPVEVDEVFMVPFKELIDPCNRLHLAGEKWRGPAFRIRDYIIWGFTAQILHLVIHRAGWERPWDHSHTLDLKAALRASRNSEISQQYKEA